MDTIVYKLHNASHYPLILDAVKDIEKEGKGITKIPKELMNAEKIEYQDAWMNLKLGTIFFFNYNVKLHIPSSSTGIIIMHDSQKDIIKFEFSIPKFLFANNVCEIIPPYTSMYHKPIDQGMVSLCCKFWYKLMKMIFQKVIFELTNGTAPKFSWTHVQVSRIDIAFNQIFQSPQDAFFYLDSQKKLRVPKSSEKMYHAYETGIAFQNPRYYWKIYHKGSDFAHTGRNQIISNFAEFHNDHKAGFTDRGEVHQQYVSTDRNHDMVNLSFQMVDHLQTYADKILRYELSCKGGLMSYLFNWNLKKKNIKAYKPLCKAIAYLFEPTNYELMRDSHARYETATGMVSAKYIKHYTEVTFRLPARYFDEKPDDPHKLVKVWDLPTLKRLEKIHLTLHFLKKHYSIEGLKLLKKLNSFLSKEQSKYHQFFFEIDTVCAHQGNPNNYNVDDDGISPDYLDLLDETDTRQRFTPHVLRLLILKHNKLFAKFQFEELPNEKQIELQVKDANLKRKSKLNTEKKEKHGMRGSQVLLLYELLKHTTWDELKKSKVVDRKTIYRWKERIKKLQGSSNDVNFLEKEFIKTVPRDTQNLYSRHYTQMLSQETPLYKFVNSQHLLLI